VHCDLQPGGPFPRAALDRQNLVVDVLDDPRTRAIRASGGATDKRRSEVNEDEIARGVARGLHQHEMRRAQGTNRSLLAGLLVLAAFSIGFILLVTYG
jgi:hypothetical protein